MFLLLGLFSCSPKETLRNTECSDEEPLSSIVQTAVQQIGFQVRLIEESGRILNPRTVHNGKVQYISKDDWTSGFFPGTLFYMYDLTGEDHWKVTGVKYTEDLDLVKCLKWHHDIGFMINCSFGNALQITGNETYKEVLIFAVSSVHTRTSRSDESWPQERLTRTT